MKKATTKGISSLFVIIFAFSSLPIISLAVTIEPVETTVDDISKIRSDPAAEYAEGFYDGIGEIFTAYTDDDIDIKVFRYHAPGKDFNDGAQPILLFPALCVNINQYLQHTTAALADFQIELPEVIAEWAIGDENIEADPMLYYSLAYYLWKMGYDPFFANYRGIGYGEMRSEDGGKKTCMDQFAVFDAKAAVKKVNEITGLHPVIGGHSTGGLTCIMYLQGTQFRWDGHLRSYSSIVDERNGDTKGPETVEGFIALDPAMIPAMTDLLDNLLIWSLLATDLVIDLRALLEFMLDIDLIDQVIRGVIPLLDSDILGETITNLLWSIANLDLDNIDGPWMYFFIKYAVDKLYFRTLSQYLDSIDNQVVREYFKNGFFNKLILDPPRKRWWDGYYYYTDHMDKISVPVICFLATMENEIMDLVDADQIRKDLMDGKTKNSNDECYDIAGAHIDMPIGLRAPVDVCPKIGEWLAKI